LRRFNAESDFFARRAMLPEIFGRVGNEVVVLQGLAVDVGLNIEIGDFSFINVNATLLDTYPIRIGASVQIGPNCGLYPVGHPLEARGRSFAGVEDGAKRSTTTGAPITIEDDVWIGGHVVVLPGGNIGASSRIGAGCVVTNSIPPDVFAAGNPCRVIKPIDNAGFTTYGAG